MEPDKRGAPAVGLILVLLATLGAFALIDVFLARMESSERGVEARHYYDQGVRLLSTGNAVEAVDLLRKAHAIERTNAAYQVQLAQALISRGKSEEAGALLQDLLQRSPNGGDANLLESRLMAQQGNAGEAIAYYHRAIYGIWRSNPEQRRKSARLELAQYLAVRGDKTDLLAELLLLGADPRLDPADLPRVAKLYLQAGSPSRAEAAYRDLIRGNPRSPENYSGLGDAQLALGDYRGAEASYQNVARLGGGGEIEQRLQLAETMAALDPTMRKLSSTEKYRRSMTILKMARDALAACLSLTDHGMISDADKALSEKIRGPMNNEVAEDRLALAQQLWQTRLSSCGPSTSPAEESLRLVMEKLAQ